MTRHCHADGQGPCLAGDCPLPRGSRPARCPGAEGEQHPATPPTVRTVADLRRALDEVPDYYELGVEVIVGGDVITDTVALERTVIRDGGSAGPYVELIPAASSYEVREHIDNGLACYHALEDAEVLGTGFIRYTRDDTVPGGVILDHVDAKRVTVLDD